MKKADFIDWLYNTSSFERTNANYEDEWRELQNYAEFIWDELTVEETTVTFTWEEFSWGSRETKSEIYSFEEFIERYAAFTLRN